MVKRFYIYILIDPRTDEIRYVGKTIHPAARLSAHWREPANNCHRSHWIQDLRRERVKPQMEILETITTYEDDERLWKESEKFWIVYLKSIGARLVNNTSGGDGAPGMPLETRARIGAASRSRKASPETLAKLSAASRGRYFSQESNAKRNASLRAVHHREDWNSRVAEAIRKFSPDQVLMIKQRIDAGEKTGNLAREYGVHRTTMSKIKMGTYFDRYRTPVW